MRLLDSRRLTGPNLIWEHPGAVIDINFGDHPPELVIGAWRREVRKLLDNVGWRDEHLGVRRFTGGASLAISGPVDALYVAAEINEAAWDAVRDLLEGGHTHLMHRVARQLRGEIRDEERPRLRRLMDAARERGVTVVLDTEDVSLGLGRNSRCWSLRDVPHPDDVDWSELGSIPLALVTGTNGKTTTVRLMSAIGQAAGFTTGISSTDWLAIGQDIVDRDDYAGPQGARTVLRDRRCDLAVLETARGGLLRRGLAVSHADAALITNIAADHIGDFGVQNIEELADVKWVVTRALGDSGVLVLNADDALLVARAKTSPARLIWFSPDPRNPVLKAHAATGGTICTLNRGRIVLARGTELQPVVAIKQIPICFGGAARHNVANALGATALASALCISPESIANGLRALRIEDNPGRANFYSIKGAQVLLDFAHNPHGLRAMIDMAASLPAQRRLLIIGQAGDRSDEDIRDLARAAEALSFERILIKELPTKNRGRPAGEVAALLKDEFMQQGYRARQIATVKNELAALRAALRWTRSGDLVVFLAHEDRTKAEAMLKRLDESSTADGAK